MATATHSKTSKFEIKIGSNWTKCNGLKTFSIGGGSASQIDITDLDSTSKEFLIGLSDQGEVSLGFNWNKSDPGQVGLRAARNSEAKTEFRLTIADQEVWSFFGLVTGEDVSGGVDEVVPFSASIKITGDITKSDPSA